MTKATETDVARWREERDSLIGKALARPTQTAQLQPKERIDGVLRRSEERECRISELDKLIAQYEADHA